jgi:hypothetical protein
MLPQEKHPFIQWIDEIEAAQGWTDNKWTTKAGLSASVLSRARQGVIPKWEACVALAEAAKRSPITAFRKAGLLPSGPDDEIRFEDWKYLLSQLSPEDQEEMRQLFVMRIGLREKENSLRSLNPSQKKVG